MLKRILVYLFRSDGSRVIVFSLLILVIYKVFVKPHSKVLVACLEHKTTYENESLVNNQIIYLIIIMF